MKPTQTGYLYDLAFEEGEFQEAEVLFDAAIDDLAGFLRNPVGDAMQNALGREVAQEWVSSAHQVLSQFVPALDVPAGAASEASHALMQSLLASKRLSNEAIELEIQACSRELAELVLERWFKELHALSVSADGVRLNASMLPGTLSTTELIETIDLGMYGVTAAAVALAMRKYREQMIAQAAQGIARFGRQLYVLFDPAEPADPFMCFPSMVDALRMQTAHSAALRSAQAHRGASAFQQTQRIGDMVTAIRQATLRVDETSVDLQVLVETVDALVRGTLHPSPPWADAMCHANERAAWMASPELMLLESAGMGVDIFSTGLHANLPEAQLLLSRRSGPIRDLLFCYADARDVKPGTARDIYAVTVAASIECQHRFGALDEKLMPSAAQENFHARLRSVYGLSTETAKQLMEDSLSGTTFLTPSFHCRES